ncbi:MAG: PDZ domain-containing protein, partial [Polyangiaceae bacterium]
CQKDLGSESEDWLGSKEVLVQCEGGATLLIGWEPPHARFGYGFYYELRSESIYVTRVFEESPASKAGMQTGDQILSLGDRPVKTMKVGDVQSYLNTHRAEPIKVEVKHADKQIAVLEMKEGAVYPTFPEYGTLPLVNQPNHAGRSLVLKRQRRTA